MARILDNDKKFKVIVLSQEEGHSLGWGLLEGFVCMNCNKLIEGKLYYVAVLNDAMCKSCYEEWLKTAKHYNDDVPYEMTNFLYYKNKLNL